MTYAWVVATQTVEGRDLRLGAGAMLAAAAVWPLLPVHPPLACPLRSATGIPCPLCGMTRAVVAAVHGDLVGSLRYNPGGLIVVFAAIALLVGGWRLTRIRLPDSVLPPALALLGGLWVYNIAWNPTFQ